MRTFTLPVTMTNEDVKYGRDSDCIHCPYALAIHRALAPFEFIECFGVFIRDMHFNIHGLECWIENHYEMRNWIRSFDYADESERRSFPVAPPFNLVFNLDTIPKGYHDAFNL